MQPHNPKLIAMVLAKKAKALHDGNPLDEMNKEKELGAKNTTQISNNDGQSTKHELFSQPESSDKNRDQDYAPLPKPGKFKGLILNR